MHITVKFPEPECKIFDKKNSKKSRATVPFMCPDTCMSASAQSKEEHACSLFVLEKGSGVPDFCLAAKNGFTLLGISYPEAEVKN
jgi:hypothetical protein